MSTSANMLPLLPIKKLSLAARIPTKAYPSDAGYDLYCSETTIIPARGSGSVKTDICIAISEEWYGRVAPRSGLAFRHDIDVGAGVVDSGYRGEIKVKLFNHGDEDFVVEFGNKIAQLIITKCLHCEVVEVDELEATYRGTSGFGSTGR